jgi:hypothetical protein
MNKDVKQAINTIKTFLGMEVKLEEMKLADGQTTIQADSFEKGQAVMIVVPDAEPIPLEVGEYELEDGRILVVQEVGMIAEIKEKAMEEEPQEEEMPVEADTTPEVTPTQTAKKIVKSTIEEQHFAKVEELEAKIVELEAKIVELSKVDEVVEETIELETVKPITFNPENETTFESIDLTPKKVKATRDKILEEIYNNK